VEGVGRPGDVEGHTWYTGDTVDATSTQNSTRPLPGCDAAGTPISTCGAPRPHG